MIYMSVVDYYQEPKIPYYFLKQACEPVLISFEQTDDRINVWLVNDSPETLSDTLSVELVNFNGEVKKQVNDPLCLRWLQFNKYIDLLFYFAVEIN